MTVLSCEDSASRFFFLPQGDNAVFSAVKWSSSVVPLWDMLFYMDPKPRRCWGDVSNGEGACRCQYSSTLMLMSCEWHVSSGRDTHKKPSTYLCGITPLLAPNSAESCSLITGHWGSDISLDLLVRDQFYKDWQAVSAQSLYWPYFTHVALAYQPLGFFLLERNVSQMNKCSLSILSRSWYISFSFFHITTHMYDLNKFSARAIHQQGNQGSSLGSFGCIGDQLPSCFCS